MPTATLTFDLDTEREQFDGAVNWWAYRSVLRDVDDDLRKRLKNDPEMSDEARHSIEWARRVIAEWAEYHGVEVW